jgi:hypothetical protein
MAESLDMEVGSDRTERILNLYREDIEKGDGKRFDPLDNRTRELLRGAFESDLEEIDKCFPSCLRKFG